MAYKRYRVVLYVAGRRLELADETELRHADLIAKIAREVVDEYHLASPMPPHEKGIVEVQERLVDPGPEDIEKPAVRCVKIQIVGDYLLCKRCDEYIGVEDSGAYYFGEDGPYCAHCCANDPRRKDYRR